AASCGYDSQDDAEMLVRRLQEEAEAQKRLVDMRERKREKARELKSEAAAQETELLRVRGRIAELLREAKAENEEDFRRRAALFERICRLRQQSEHYAALVYAQCGERERDKLIAALRAEDEQSLNRKLNETAAEIAELDNRLAQLLVEKGALEHRIQALESDGSHADKLQQLEEEVALLRHSAKEWAVYALSLRLIQAAKEICEKDKQPGVLLRASAYFRLITGGKFTRVLAPVGAKLLKVERANGEQLEPAQLSRGTAEQLYLSMRFALAAEIAQKALMPIIMDDIFVNFDKPRLLHALKAVEKVAQKQQVLLFTCHAHVREAVLAVMPDARLLPLDGSS
ncbi:MAG TPA: recombination protein RecF, partial [Bacilli bacterium]